MAVHAPTRGPRIVVAVLLGVCAVACGGADDQTSTDAPATEPLSTQGDSPSPAAETSDPEGACALLPKAQVERALGTAALTPVTDSTYECAYGAEGEEAQVTFSTGTLAGTLDGYQSDLARFQETLGRDHVRVLSGIGQAAFVVDNGSGGGFFASALGEGGHTINIYIYPLVTYDDAAAPSTEITNARLYEAGEAMLAAVAPML